MCAVITRRLLFRMHPMVPFVGAIAMGMTGSGTTMRRNAEKELHALLHH